MLAAQYSIALPADYDMAIIRRRVAERGASLDDRVGLGLKAYLVEDRTNGGRQNQYAPFYLWNDPHAASQFLWGGGGFSGIVRDFGRPNVATWLGVRFARGPARTESPTWATLERRALLSATDPADDADNLAAEVTELASQPHVHSVAAAIDPSGWGSVLLTLRTNRGGSSTGTVFEVLHLSAPGLTALDGGIALSGK